MWWKWRMFGEVTNLSKLKESKEKNWQQTTGPISHRSMIWSVLIFISLPLQFRTLGIMFLKLKLWNCFCFISFTSSKTNQIYNSVIWSVCPLRRVFQRSCLVSWSLWGMKSERSSSNWRRRSVRRETCLLTESCTPGTPATSWPRSELHIHLELT